MRATMAEQIAINAKLQEVCKAVEGIAIYAEGWNDQMVATMVAPRLTANHVAYVRKQMGFGNLKTFVKHENSKDIEELQAFIVQLVRDFDNQAKHLAMLNQRVKGLEAQIYGPPSDNVEAIRKL